MKKNVIKPYIYALLTTIALFIDSKKIYTSIRSVSNPFEIGLFTVTICFIFLVILYKRSIIYNESKLKISFALLLSFFMVFGNSYLKINSWNLVFGNLLMIFISIISYVGYFLLFMVGINYLDIFIKEKIAKKKDIKLNPKLEFFLKGNVFLKCFLLIIGCWLIYILAFYPIVISPDPTTQIMQFYGLSTKYSESVILLNPNVLITCHHPLLYTLFLGGSSYIGNLIGNSNLGLFIYSFVQIIITASIYAYSIKYMAKINTPHILRIIVLLIYCFVPMYPLFSMAAVKDTLYTAFIFMYVIMLFDTIRFYSDKKISIKRKLCFIVVCLLISLYRNNGIFVVILSFPFLLFRNKKNRIKLLISFLGIISLYGAYDKILLPYLEITPGSKREALSIPFQQIARYTKYYGDELTKDDISVIDKILDYNTLADRYNPVFADSVKDKYNKNTTDEDLNNFFSLWFKLLKKRPNVFIEATMNNVYGYFYPNSIRWYLYYSYEGEIRDMQLVDFHFNNMKYTRSVLAAIGISFPYFPIVGLLANVGFNTWCVLYMTISFIYLKKKEYLVTLSPLLISLLICIASPVNTYFRYTMPFVFLMPFMWSIFIDANQKR